MSETGAVKFNCEHIARELAPFDGFAELNSCRSELRARKFVGIDAGGIGYGNLSIRDGLTNRFFITGSGTGVLEQLGLDHYAHVITCDFDRNWLHCEGAVVASSESLTHAAIYEIDSSVRAVIHVHSAALWKKLLARAPTTSGEVEYGTPAMAHEVRRLFETTDVKARKIFAMSGHVDGIVAFGVDLPEALRALM